MKDLLIAIVDHLREALPYLSWVGVLDSEFLPPREPQPPFVGVLDGGLVAESIPGQKDNEELTVTVVAYQAILTEPGASILGASELGDQGKGLIDITGDIRDQLNDRTFSLPIYFAHCAQMSGAETLSSDEGALLQTKKITMTYRRIR